MTSPRGPVLGLIFVMSAPAAAQVTPDQQAEMAINAARKAQTEGNLPAARELYKQFLAKHGNHARATAARYGLGLCAATSPDPDYAAALEPLNQAAGDGGFADRGPVLVLLANCYRGLGLKDLEKPPAAANEAAQKRQQATQRFNEADRWFNEAGNWYVNKKDFDQAGRCRADRVEMLLRGDRVKDARAAGDAFEKDAAFAKAKSRPLGLYYLGLACFLDKDYAAAGRCLNQLAPFADPGYGPHARYLVGRVLQLNGENAEASVHYDGVLAEFEKQKKDAAAKLQQPDQLKGNPGEKTRLEALAKGPVPEYVSGAIFHGATLGYEAGRFADALGRFQAFAKDFPNAALVPDANLRIGFCLVQLKQFDEAAKALAPIPEKTPRLADQAMFWLGKAELGVAAAADPANAADRDAKLKKAVDTLRKAAEKAGQAAQQEPEAKARRGDCLLELGDALSAAKQFAPALQAYEQAWNERLLPERRLEEVLQRLASAAGQAGDANRSDQWCNEFKQKFPQSPLTPAVIFRLAENAYARAELTLKNSNQAGERKPRFEEAAKKYQEVVDRFPEFERVSYARYGVGVCQVQLGDIEGAVKALDAIPAPDRAGELSPAAYLLADCLIRLAPAKADDALAENIIREKLTAASGLLENYVASNPKAADAPDALMKLGLCLKRLGSTLADANERNQLLNKAREFYEKLAKEYPQAAQVGHARLEIAKVRALMGDRGGAMNDLRQFAGPLEKSPVAPLGMLQLAVMFREENKPAEAVKVLDEARKKFEPGLAADKERGEWAFLLKYQHGVALFETGQFADAQKLFEEVVKQAAGKPVGAEAALRSGQARAAEGRKLIDAGKQKLGDAKQRPAGEKEVADGRAAVNQAADSLERRCGEFAQALPGGEPRARMLYDAAWMYRYLSEDEISRQWDQMRKDAGEKRLQDLAKTLPAGAKIPALPPADVPRDKVPIQHMEDRTLNAYKRLIDEFPDLALTVDARFELAELKADRNDHDGAIKLLKEALDKEPSDRTPPAELLEKVRVRLGGSYFAKKDYKAAAGQFDTVAENEKGTLRGQALYRSAEALFAAGEFAKAAEKLAPFRDRGELHNIPNVSDRAFLRLGQCHAAAKNWDPARQAYEAFLGRYGNSPYAADARYGYGWVLQNQAKYDEAVNQYDACTKLTTAEVAAKAQTQIGLCRMAQKRYAEASAALLVVPYTYDFPELGYAAILEAARAFAEDKKPDQAAKLLAKLLKDAPPESEWAKAAKERLGQK